VGQRLKIKAVETHDALCARRSIPLDRETHRWPTIDDGAFVVLDERHVAHGQHGSRPALGRCARR
jgi:hypothetical protein